MKTCFVRSSLLGVSAMLLATCGYAGAQVSPQSAQPGTQAESTQAMQQSTPQNMQLVSVSARLVHSLDSKSASQGQSVTAKLTGDVKTPEGVKLNKGTMLMGKVAQVQRSNDNGPSRLSIVLDQARLKDGRTIPVKATLLGAYPASTGNYYADTGTNGTLVAGQSRFISADQKVEQLPGTLSHVGMHSAVQSNMSGTFISKDHNIQLRSGTRLQIAIAPMTAGNGMAG